MSFYSAWSLKSKVRLAFVFVSLLTIGVYTALNIRAAHLSAVGCNGAPMMSLGSRAWTLTARPR